jgi:membrane-associated protease RseP (regulator of RpoE activity)
VAEGRVGRRQKSASFFPASVVISNANPIILHTGMEPVMAQRKKASTGLLGTVKSKIVALIASAFTVACTSGTVYFWDKITGVQHPDGEKESKTVSEVVVDKIREKLGKQAAPEGVPVQKLNCTTVADGGAVRIVTVPPGSTAALLGLIPNDFIVSVGNKNVFTPQELEGELEAVGRFFGNSVRVRRGDVSFKGEVISNSDKTLRVARHLAAD